MMETYWILLAFVTKHFICDYPLQMMPYQYKNKGIYGHFGGILHAVIHAIGSAVVLYSMTTQTPHIVALCCCADFLVHYHVDWAKMNFCARYNLQPTNSDWYWFVLGLDQYLHYLTYFAIVLSVTGAG